MGREPKTRESAVIMGRLWLVGEGAIPMELFEGLDNGELWIFLEEPDMEKWPPEMKRIKEWMEEHVTEHD